jgi:hypothetical protein
VKVTVEIRRPGWMTSRRLKRARPLVLLLALALASPVLASDTFTDVPTDSVHHNDINTIKVAGITRGCNPPDNTLYCPADPVRRDQMASFLQRGLGRGARSTVANAEHDFHVSPAALGTVSLAVPGSGFVLVTASVNASQFVDTGFCVSAPYILFARVSDPVSSATSMPMEEAIAASGTGSVATTFFFDVDVSGPTTRDFNVDAWMSQVGCYDVDFDLTATWVPFGSTGGSGLGAGSSSESGPGRSEP